MKARRELLFLGLIVLVFLALGIFSKLPRTSDQMEFTGQGEALVAGEDLVEDKTINKAYIIGQVVRPGVYEFQPGDRVDDLIMLAGGCTEEADLEAVNLAMNLKDEMKVYVPSLGEVGTEINSDNKQALEGADQPLVNINQADIEELKSLDGIGEAKAKAIIEFREELPFEKIEEILNVPGIGPGIFERIKDSIGV